MKLFIVDSSLCIQTINMKPYKLYNMFTNTYLTHKPDKQIDINSNLKITVFTLNSTTIYHLKNQLWAVSKDNYVYDPKELMHVHNCDYYETSIKEFVENWMVINL